MFKNIKEVNLNFNGCQSCPDTCCKDKLLIPLVLEDFEFVYENFPIVFAYLNDKLRVFILLSNDGKGCRYLGEKGCGIYEKRPPSCKIYPLSPFFEEFYVDTSCEAVGENGEFLCSNKGFNQKFYHSRLENFKDKYTKTEKFLFSIDNNIKKIGNIKEIGIYKYSGEVESEYIKMHNSSLKYLVN